MPPPSQPPFPLGALMFLPGTGFWVLVIIGATRDDDRFVVAAFVLAAVSLAIYGVLKLRQSRDKRVHRVRAVEAGTRTTARIVSTRVRGQLNQDPYVVFGLEVTPEKGEPYRVEVTELVSQLAIPRIQPETVIEVHVHPDDPGFVVIDPQVLGRSTSP